MNEKGVLGIWKTWPLNAFYVKAMKDDSQFGPPRLLFLWPCEEF